MATKTIQQTFSAAVDRLMEQIKQDRSVLDRRSSSRRISGSGPARAAQAWAKMNGVPALAQMGVVNAEEVDKKVRSLLLPYALSVEAWVRAHV